MTEFQVGMTTEQGKVVPAYRKEQTFWKRIYKK